MTSPSAIFTFLLYLIAASTALASLLGYLGRLSWYLELFSHFRLQYAAIASICALAFLLIREYAGFYLSLCISLFNFALILPLYHRPHPHPSSRHTYRILSANLLGPNRSYLQIHHMLQETKPDLAILLEYDHHHHEKLQDLLQDFPHTYFLPRDDNFGLALVSRLPLISIESLYLNQDRLPVVVAQLILDDHPLTIIGSHPTPPKSKELTAIRDRQINSLANFAAQQDGEVILVGDINTTSWSYPFHDLLRKSKLMDSRLGFGVQPTWPANMPLMRIPIDHLLHTPGIHITNRRVGSFNGSDHLPIIVEFNMNQDPHS